MMDEQQILFGSSVTVDRPDSVSQAGSHVFGEDLGGDAHAAKVILQIQHLLGDGVPARTAGMELVNGREAIHLVATMT
jgi:hypothetical protein